ncbi:protein translocase subunit SecD [Cyanobacterium aponinum UTEX 3222]|uniref:Protein translocase subunit SecD n=2 Tax=Cyanobacterium aponinum TaxID=379064 RepID=A0A844GT64_9CHRO|nr:protein translocase subunit SecD [Cyanobacterium aponinum]WRL43211.1 protein translocase subunit SecD [Cyanobacterium aponinum UTEX 3222]MBD2395340.1 protein translocase subunit SecD [Cyanobacterium aponinum FACHB-4101]MTF38242.1 protein translocase subunit SecD [Cyanobacterium aponinum 0216]PHV64070.1 protein translocase subunit SecD [Cyanobacterium aponinum IPPAS B-1201]WPF87817.1 protein translocase subunit SecD [Cyanobacterium aponinum AL20115]
MERQRAFIILIIILVATAIVTLVNLPLQLGLDLRGGSQLTIQLETTPQVPEITPEKLQGVQSVISNRVNGLGVSEAVVQTVGSDRILVQLPGVSDPEEAERVLGGTALLDFRVETDNQEIRAEYQIKQQELASLIFQAQSLQGEALEAQQSKIEAVEKQIEELSTQLYEKTELNGEKLQGANFQPAPQGNDWEVVLEFNNEGGRLFAELTKQIAGTGRTLGIFLDNELISSPTVSAEYASTGIMGGRATISGGGGFTLEQARELALQLEGGALPLPVKIVENRTVGATLGQDSIRRSIIAGLVGLALVLVYMVIYYRLPGFLADIALIIYALLTLACFSLAGVTLTLPGIAGFVLSIGMAVDANVLIFERTREELRDGKTLYRSVESGFYRAFSSILDGNVTTLIACAALFWLGSGLVKGFALTLAIGVVVSMFTALTCSRTLLLITVLGFPAVRQRPELFCPNLKAVNN